MGVIGTREMALSWGLACIPVEMRVRQGAGVRRGMCVPLGMCVRRQYSRLVHFLLWVGIPSWGLACFSVEMRVRQGAGVRRGMCVPLHSGWERQDLGAGIRDQQGVLELGAATPILSDHGPVVGPQVVVIGSQT